MFGPPEDESAVADGFWAGTDKIDNEKKTDTKRRIRERIRINVENGSQKAGYAISECKDGILRSSRTGRNEVGAVVES